MVVVEVELNGVVSHGCSAGDLDDVLAVNGKRVGRDLHGRRGVAAGRTRTALPQIGVGISGFVPVIPPDEHTARSGEFDSGGSNVHKTSDLKAENDSDKTDDRKPTGLGGSEQPHTQLWTIPSPGLRDRVKSSQDFTFGHPLPMGEGWG